MKRIVLIGLILVGLLSTASATYADDSLEFKAKLTGAQEVPAVVTATKGEAEFEVNKSRTKIKFKLEIEDAADILAVAGAHIHCGPAGVTGPVVVFLAGVHPGGLDGDLEIEATLTQDNIVNRETGCGATIAELVDAMRDGKTYVNAHSTANPGGEVRGQIRED